MENNITISYRIKESELESETTRLYNKALTKLSTLPELSSVSADKTLSFQTLECAIDVKKQLAECVELFSNVENIVSQYLEHKANTVFEQPPPTEPQVAPDANTTVQEMMDNMDDTYAKQRKLAQEVSKYEDAT
jgi:hypothetical protein